jgi:hypothetical protein
MGEYFLPIPWCGTLTISLISNKTYVTVTFMIRYNFDCYRSGKISRFLFQLSWSSIWVSTQTNDCLSAGTSPSTLSELFSTTSERLSFASFLPLSKNNWQNSFNFSISTIKMLFSGLKYIFPFKHKSFP